MSNLYRDEKFLLVEKYRPRRIDDVILPDRIKAPFLEYIKTGDFGHLLLAGGPGIGKTTIAKALCNETGQDVMVINGSLDMGIDRLRTDILEFASKVSLSGSDKKKVVILDEADYLSREKIQPALRNFLEEYSDNCVFIFTCNYPNKIIDAIHSRTTVIQFDYEKEEKVSMSKDFMVRLQDILEAENIPFERKVLVEVIRKFFPDFRRILNEIQRYMSSGKIDSGILVNFREVEISNLIEHMEKKNFNGIEKWIKDNKDSNLAEMLTTSLYQGLKEKIKNESIPAAVIILADGQNDMVNGIDQEFQFKACIIKLLIEVEFR